MQVVLSAILSRLLPLQIGIEHFQYIRFSVYSFKHFQYIRLS